MKAILRSIHITSKKLNLIAELVRRKNAIEAMNILAFTPKKGAKILEKVVRSAVANAENNFKQERPTLFIKEIIVTEGATMKRSIPVSRGRSNPILKRTSHVTIFLGVAGEEIEEKIKAKKPSMKVVKEEKTEEEKATIKEVKVSKKKTSKTK